MPYCDECGNEVSITDKRCSKCGNKLDFHIPDSEEIGKEVDDIFTRIKKFLSPEPHHNIEFIFALIAVIFTVMAIPDSINSYSYVYSEPISLVLIALFVSVIGAIVIRYRAKTGAILLLIGSFSLILFGVNGMFFPLIFYVIAIALAFIR